MMDIMDMNVYNVYTVECIMLSAGRSLHHYYPKLLNENICVLGTMTSSGSPSPPFHSSPFFLIPPSSLCHSLKSKKLWYETEDFFLYTAA